MGSQNPVVPLADAAGIGRERLGSKAAALADLAAAGFPVPPGLVVTADVLDHPRLDYPRLEQALTDAADKLGEGPYAVRSSAVAEDLPNASFAGLYETYLGVDRAGLIDGVRRCAAAARADRVAVYRTARDRDVTADPGPGSSIAVLVQPMIDAEAAGVAFTANPLTGRRDETVVTAVRGLGERLVSGDAVGEEWIVHNGRAECTRPGEGALDTTQAAEVAELAARVAEHYGKHCGDGCLEFGFVVGNPA